MKNRLYVLFLLCLNSHFAWGEQLPVWEVSIGLAGIQSPNYRGSNSYNTRILPFPAFTYRSEHLRLSDGKIQGLVYRSKRIKFDFSLSASLPATLDDNSARKNMPLLDPTFEIGPSLITHLWHSKDKNTNLSLEIPLRAAFSASMDNLALRGHGWVFAPFININHDYGDWELDFSFGPSYAAGQYHSYFYDISPKYITPIRPAYNASKGYSGSRATLSIDKHFKKLLIAGFARYDELSDAVFMDSPLVERSNNLTMGFVIMWKIAKSKKSIDYYD